MYVLDIARQIGRFPSAESNRDLNMAQGRQFEVVGSMFWSQFGDGGRVHYRGKGVFLVQFG